MLTDNTLDKLIGYAPITDDQNIGYNTYRYNQQGGIDIGYPIDPVRPVVWSLMYDLGQKRFYIQSDSGISYHLLNHPTNIQITQISFSFDVNNQVVWTYSYIDEDNGISFVSLNRYNKNNRNNHAIPVVISDATSPTLSLDVDRNIGATRQSKSVIFAYLTADTSELMVRESDDNFVQERKVATLKDNEYIVKSGMTVGRRFKISTREAVGRMNFKALLTSTGGLLLDKNGNPLWVTHHQRN